MGENVLAHDNTVVKCGMSAASFSVILNVSPFYHDVFCVDVFCVSNILSAELVVTIKWCMKDAYENHYQTVVEESRYQTSVCRCLEKILSDQQGATAAM